MQEPDITNDDVNDDLMTFPADTLNFSLFMEIFRNMATPSGATFLEIKNHLAENGFYIDSKKLTDFLFRGVTKLKIEKIHCQKKYKPILPETTLE